MPPPRPSLDAELSAEYEQARLAWLRRRLFVYAWFGAALSGASLIAFGLGAFRPGRTWRAQSALSLSPDAPSDGTMMLGVLATVLQVVIFIGAIVRLRSRPPTNRAAVIRPLTVTLMAYLLLQLAAAPAAITLLNEQLAGRAHLGIGVPVMIGVVIMHLAASLILPLTPGESIRPALPALGFITAGMCLSATMGKDPWGVILVVLVMLYASLLPGLLVCWLREGAFAQRFIAGRYQEVRRDLDLARRIHERLFPMRVEQPGLRIDYAYEPMRQIGGDFVFISPVAADLRAPERWSVVLVDVTGHGIGAALAVNRVHAELRRIVGTSDLSPASLLAALNDYVALTMSADSMFATAFALDFEPASGRLRWASAGHPAGFLVRSAGVVEDLESTTFMLGAVPTDQFDASDRESVLLKGDQVVLYTDGAIEAMDDRGRQHGEPAVRAAAASPTPCRAIMDAVRQHSRGVSLDDVLVVSIVRTAMHERGPDSLQAGAP